MNVYAVRGEYSFQYVVAYTTKKSKQCTLQGHGKGCEHTSAIPGDESKLGELLLPTEDEQKWDFKLSDYECKTNEPISSEDPEDISEEAKVYKKQI